MKNHHVRFKNDDDDEAVYVEASLAAPLYCISITMHYWQKKIKRVCQTLNLTVRLSAINNNAIVKEPTDNVFLLYH